MGVLASDSPAVRFHQKGWEPTACINITVGLEHTLVADIQPLIIRIKAIGVFHGKLSYPQQTSAGAGFIPEFDLYLINIQREITVALHIMADKVGYHLLVSWSQDHFVVPAVFKME